MEMELEGVNALFIIVFTKRMSLLFFVNLCILRFGVAKE
jgi:hypothetical protein